MESLKHPVSTSRLVPRLGVNHHLGGLPASRNNLLLLQQYYEAWFNLARDVMIWQGMSDESQVSRLSNLSKVVRENDPLDILNVCQSAASLLICNEVSTYGDFKDRLCALHSVPLSTIQGLLSPISPVLVSLFECPDIKAESLQPILNYLRFGKKLSFESIGLESKSIADYLATEERLSTVMIDVNDPLVRGVASIIHTWLSGLKLSAIIPRHGSGSVAEGPLDLGEKFANLKQDTYLRIVLGQYWREYYPTLPGNDLVRVSRTIFVPKTFSKLRTISMEPCTLQYFQQGVMIELYDYIDHHPYLGRRVLLRDQTQNQRFARQGSMDNSLSTIDLSSASDSVSWALVKAVFARTPLLKWLYATRSKSTKLPDGSELQLRKFAPMGSALCFPVECIIFAAVIEYVSQKWCHTNRRAKLDYSVFGDDLVVPTVITDEVFLCLKSLGFVVNKEKSFVNGPFRESCGKDYYEGLDVSSVYYRLPAYSTRCLSPDVYSSICSSANLAYGKNLLNLRRYYISILLCSRQTAPYFTSSDQESPSLYSPTPTNFHVKARWHKDYQRRSGWFCSVKSKPKHKEPLTEDHLRYFVKLSEMARRSDTVNQDCQPSAGITLHGARTYLGFVDREI